MEAFSPLFAFIIEADGPAVPRRAEVKKVEVFVHECPGLHHSKMQHHYSQVLPSMGVAYFPSHIGIILDRQFIEKVITCVSRAQGIVPDESFEGDK